MSKNKNNKPVWSTRINQKAASTFQKVGSSLNVDKRLFREDITASIAHVEMLEKQKIITVAVKNKIIWGLKKILNEIIKKKFSFDERNEDIHMSIEKRLFEILGEDAGFIHTARSRNDQVLTDLKILFFEFVSAIIIEFSALNFINILCISLVFKISFLKSSKITRSCKVFFLVIKDAILNFFSLLFSFRFL